MLSRKNKSFVKIQKKYQDKLVKVFYEDSILPFCKKWGLSFYSGMGVSGFLSDGMEFEYDVFIRLYENGDINGELHEVFVPFFELDSKLLNEFAEDFYTVNDFLAEKEIVVAIGNQEFRFLEYKANTGAIECVFYK